MSGDIPISRTNLDDEKFENFVCKIVTEGGLTCDTHTVQTEDGYLLSLFRVRDPNNFKEGAPAALLFHGFLSDSVMWVTHRDKSMTFELAKHGYDVWLGNTRGSIFSRKHKNLDPYKDPIKYYDYSFYEHGKYDTTSSIDHILNVTGHEKLAYIGHSQGTT